VAIAAFVSARRSADPRHRQTLKGVDGILVENKSGLLLFGDLLQRSRQSIAWSVALWLVVDRRGARAADSDPRRSPIPLRALLELQVNDDNLNYSILAPMTIACTNHSRAGSRLRLAALARHGRLRVWRRYADPPTSMTIARERASAACSTWSGAVEISMDGTYISTRTASG
jgi:hypothetical protein